MHAHNVYFKLKDSSKTKIGNFIEDCHSYLARLDGIHSFACGLRETRVDRPVNDKDFDVSLHIIFRDKEAHDSYQVAGPHEEFVQRNKPNWEVVRVFDTVTR